MNIYLIIVLAAIIGGWMLQTTGAVLGLGRLGAKLPAEFEGSMNEECYARSQKYAAAGMKLNIIQDTISTGAFLGFLLLGGFGWADAVSRGAGGRIAEWAGIATSGTGGTSGTGSEIIIGLCFFALLMLLSGVLSLPFSIWHTFVHEARFGFNKTTPATFVADRIKGFLLTVIIGGPLAAGVLWLLLWLGAEAWLPVWGLVTVISLLLTFLAPRYLLPLFNTFTPLPDGSLRNAIQVYVERQGYRISGLFAVDGSRRSAKVNAYFTGLGKERRIALFDTLMGKLDEEEVVAVVAHEVGHCKLGHVPVMMIISVARTGFMLWLLSFFLTEPQLFAAFGVHNVSAHAGLVFFSLLFTPVSLLTGMGFFVLTRRNEYAADAFAAKTTGRPDVLRTALRKLASENLSNLTPHPLQVALHYTHPPLVQRLQALEAMSISVNSQ
ncbi:M48 family metallopeptidase [Oleidesulfovibrio sp.]|uniref:M48 family metallopeptidase n=1 Tax=Oleidesulfovibrio sp. TaxID=2909707 RepID=UPI003A8AB0C6